jgi:hypothetical protein
MRLAFVFRFRVWGSRKEADLEVAIYSSGPIGRPKAANVLALVRTYKQNRD